VFGQPNSVRYMDKHLQCQHVNRMERLLCRCYVIQQRQTYMAWIFKIIKLCCAVRWGHVTTNCRSRPGITTQPVFATYIFFVTACAMSKILLNWLIDWFVTRWYCASVFSSVVKPSIKIKKMTDYRGYARFHNFQTYNFT